MENVKRIAICCDGTWNRADQAFPTNVARTATAILPAADGVEQRVFYDSGVGTGGRLDRILGGLLGLGLRRRPRCLPLPRRKL